MSTPSKPRGTSGGLPEMTKLKLLWRDSLSESARDYWRALFISATTQAEIRKQILSRLKITLKQDNALSEFRQWLEKQDARDAEAEAQMEDERRIKEQFGDSMTKDQIREKVLSASYARTIATGDFKLGLATVDRDLKSQQISLDREKFEEMQRRAAAFDQAKGVMGDQALSEEQRASRMRELFGM